MEPILVSFVAFGFVFYMFDTLSGLFPVNTFLLPSCRAIEYKSELFCRL